MANPMLLAASAGIHIVRALAIGVAAWPLLHVQELAFPNSGWL